MNLKKQYVPGLVSVIVPAYNVKDYLEECVDSICNQTYKNLEIIVVDDGSNDGTEAICDSFTDKRITIIHQRNKGLSVARNTGIEVATGEYLSFIDSDDYIRENMIYELVEAIKGSNAELCACGVEYKRCDDGTSTFSGNTGETSVLDYGDSIDYLCNKYLFNVWNKLYKHEIVNDIRYVEGVVCEDVGYTSTVFQRIKRTAYVDKPLYVYRVRRPGSSSMAFDARKLPALDEFERFIEYLGNNGFYEKTRFVRHNQLAMIRTLYNETEDNDKVTRKKMYLLFLRKVMKNGAWKVNILSNLFFAFLPGIVRKRYQKGTKYM